MTRFRAVKLEKCVDLLAGYAFKSQFFSDGPDDIALIKGENIGQGKILWDISKRWSADDWSKFEKFQLQSGDVIVAMDRPWVPAGLKWAFIRDDDPKALLVQRCARLRSRIPELDQNFLRFVIGAPDFEQYVRPITTGVNVPHISSKQILDYGFQLPPLIMQRRIANILSAYDDLIENNQRRIKILEEMARTLYREWFVHFRFPGHENHPRVSSPLGEIPKGWEVKRVGDVFQTVLGGTPSRANPAFWKDGSIPWINSGRVNDLRIIGASELITPLALERSAAKLMPKGTTVLAITGATLGQVSYLEIETTANQSVVGIFDPPGLRSEWIYLTIRERIEEIIKRASGGAQQHINKEIVNDVRLMIPSESLTKNFKRLVAPIFSELATLLFQSQNLRRTRDLLLPRLLSGQIDLEAA